MKPQPLTRRVLAGLCLFCSLAVHSQQVPRYDEDAPKPEIEVPLPPPPQAANLLRYRTDATTSNEIFIDTASLVFNDDDQEMVSYTILIRGAGGGENVTFESLRCVSGERRVLAYGKRDGTWSPVAKPKWVSIEDSRNNRQYYEFWRDVFCRGGAVVPRREALLNIKQGGRTRFTTPGGGG